MNSHYISVGGKSCSTEKMNLWGKRPHSVFKGFTEKGDILMSCLWSHPLSSRKKRVVKRDHVWGGDAPPVFQGWGGTGFSFRPSAEVFTADAGCYLSCKEIFSFGKKGFQSNTLDLCGDRLWFLWFVWFKGLWLRLHGARLTNRLLRGCSSIQTLSWKPAVLLKPCMVVPKSCIPWEPWKGLCPCRDNSKLSTGIQCLSSGSSLASTRKQSPITEYRAPNMWTKARMGATEDPRCATSMEKAVFFHNGHCRTVLFPKP